MRKLLAKYMTLLAAIFFVAHIVLPHNHHCGVAVATHSDAYHNQHCHDGHHHSLIELCGNRAVDNAATPLSSHDHNSKECSLYKIVDRIKVREESYSSLAESFTHVYALYFLFELTVTTHPSALLTQGERWEYAPYLIGSYQSDAPTQHGERAPPRA